SPMRLKRADNVAPLDLSHVHASQGREGIVAQSALPLLCFAGALPISAPSQIFLCGLLERHGDALGLGALTLALGNEVDIIASDLCRRAVTQGGCVRQRHRVSWP